ncbi:DNA repair protein RecN [Atopomonas sediminilitoris]|uniref:DNA repair protein RecN n=1 Tax=Atopomonas sediminilitoris TaxID=2919919 RepID=UPI001F4EFA07|nr:DNA repair protein RecN [Atopomonas sediminilitoris]MCJ8170704.1 DNA repair protein RecN [Atopomonas sediminilitoris]
MLVHLAIRNYAIVEQLDLELAPGMSAITGETGAGKSIMLGALGLALGDRTDSGIVRPSSDKADILATFDISQIPEAREWLNNRDLGDDEQVILRRVITSEGRSRGYINGTPSPQADLRELGELLIDIHSQHEHQSLLKSDTHRRLLDNYAGAAELAHQVQLAAQRWRQTQQALHKATSSSDEQQARLQLLTYQLDELESLSLGDNELERLEQQQRELSNAEVLLASCQQIIDLCADNDAGNVLSSLNTSLNRLSNLQSQNAALSEASNLLSSAQIQVEEAVGELHRFLDHFEADPQRLQDIEERLSLIYQLARKHKVNPDQLLDLQQQLLDEVESLNADDQAGERLQQELDAYARHYHEKAQALSDLRQAAANALSAAVSEQMQLLGMPGGQFAIQLKAHSNLEPHPHGTEQIDFLVSANPGQPIKPLAKVASGGELSRISLAIQVITAQTSRVPTLVFDEVDVGIGGPTAEVVGQLLRQLGARGQVLTVTHLPQVAAQGHQHLFVYKERGTDSTQSAVRCLSDDERIEEVARMLGGIDLTEESIAHARQMVSTARH